MADSKKVIDDLTTKAALSAGKDAAMRAVEDLLSTDEERARREAERAAESKRRRKKLIAYALVGTILAVGLVGMVMSYWQWFVLAGIVGLAGLYVWHRVRKRLGAKKESDDGARRERKATKQRLPGAASREPRLAGAPAGRPKQLGEARAREALAREEARDEESREVEEELAALKTRLKK